MRIERTAARFRGALIGLALLLAPAWSPTSGGRAQEEETQDPDEIAGRVDPYDRLIELRDVVYVSPKENKGKQELRLTFNVNPDVPKGAKLNFELQYNALPFVNTIFVLEGQRRRGLRLDWTPKRQLAVDEYYLRVQMIPDDQTPEVRKAIERVPKAFPASYAPWPWLYFDQPIKVGTEEERLAQRLAMCDAYGKFLDRLIENYTEFHEKMDKVKAGELAVNGSTLDEKAFEKIVVDWRKKQGAVQKDIQEMLITTPVFAAKSPTAYRHLIDLGNMVSRASVRAQKEVTDQYGLKELRPESDRYFNPAYRYSTGREALEGQLERIENLACKGLFEEEPEEAGDGSKKTGEKTGKKGGDKDADEEVGAGQDGDAGSKDAEGGERPAGGKDEGATPRSTSSGRRKKS